ncbi:MAG: hypothetical protein AAF221_15310 [Pseudomonadota bacterium]
MKRFLTTAIVIGLATTAAPLAQATGHGSADEAPKAAAEKKMKTKKKGHMPLRAAYMAEHAAWNADHERWEADHEEAVVILRAIIKQLKSENALTGHDEMIDEHGKVLEGDDMMMVAQEHAAQRVAHEEMRDAHHHLMDAVRGLALAAEEDLAAESN